MKTDTVDTKTSSDAERHSVLESPREEALRLTLNAMSRRTDVERKPSTVFHKILGIKFQVVQSLSEDQRFQFANEGRLRRDPSLNKLALIATIPGDRSVAPLRIDLDNAESRKGVPFGDFTIEIDAFMRGSLDLHIRPPKTGLLQSKPIQIRFADWGRGNDPYHPDSPVQIMVNCWDKGAGFEGSEVRHKTETLYLNPEHDPSIDSPS